MRKIVVATFALLFATAAHAQTGVVKTQAQLNTEIGSPSCTQPTCLWPDNTTGLITPFDLRQVALDMVATLFAGGGTSPVSGPASSTANHAATWNNTTGTLLQDNGLTLTPSTGTLTIANGKTLTANNSIGLSGVDGKTLTVNNSLSLAGTDGKTLTLSNSLGFSGTDSTTFAFPGTSDTVVTLAATQTLTNKTLTSPAFSGTVTGNNTIPLSVIASIGSGTVLGNNSGSSGQPSAITGPVLGVAGIVAGSIGFANLSTGSITIQPTTGALGSAVLTLPAATDTFALLAASQTLTNKTISGGTLSGTIAGTPTLSGANFVTLANIVQLAASSLLGNPTGSLANLSGITLGSTLNFSGTTLNATTASSSQLGVAKCDNVTITCAGGVFEAIGSAATSIGILTTSVSSGVAGDVLGMTNSGCSASTPCLANIALANQSTIGVKICDIILTSATTCNNGGSQANNGTYTPTAGALWIKVTVVGGGGGGGGGAAGAGSGNNGVASTFGGIITASQGVGGGSTGGIGGTGGAASGGDTNIPGGNGSGAANSTGNDPGTTGGSSCLGGNGGGGSGVGGATAATAAATNSGSGGGGGGTNTTGTGAGGAGGAGGCVFKVIVSLAGTYAYAVGTGGSGGTGGTNGGNGGAGAAGRITIEEHFNW